MPWDWFAERSCLRSLLAGKDAWPQFWDIFGFIILKELRRYDLAYPPDRDDLFQELALKLLANDLGALRAFTNSPKASSFGAYLRVMVRNVAVDYLRMRKRQGSTLVLEELDDRTCGAVLAREGSTDNPADLSTNNIDELLLTLTGNRDSQNYQILFLRFVQHEDVNVIAGRLGLSPNSVSQRIRYYLEKLRTERKIE